MLVSARDGDRFLGSALGEAGHAEEAEDRARSRLLASLAASGAPRPSRADPPPRPGTSEPPVAMPAEAPPHAVEPQAPDRRQEDPQDWSAELTELDLQMRRLGWDREREGLYLQRSFGHPSRDRITVYADLRAYLEAIELLEPGCDPATAPLPLRRSDLLDQCNRLLQQLGWDGSRGRRFLEQHLGVSSRQQLKDADLLRFNMLLEEETLQEGAEPSAPAPEI